jgi:CsoR family transcriptional regulator, copper-sensing transcriptional repressor
MTEKDESRLESRQLKRFHHMAASELSAPSDIDQGDRVHADHAHGDPADLNGKESPTHPHVHSEESLRRIVNRLSRIEGHIRGVKMMVQENRSCPDVLVQIAAVRGALDRVSRIILDEHLTECIARAAKEGNIEAEIEELKTALDRFLP